VKGKDTEQGWQRL